MPSDKPLKKRRTRYDLDRYFDLFLEATSLDAVTTKKTFLHPKEIKRRSFSQSMHPTNIWKEAPPITTIFSDNVFRFFSENRNTQHVLDNERTAWKYTCDRRLFAVYAPQREVSPDALPCAWQSCTNYRNFADMKDIKDTVVWTDVAQDSVWSWAISCFIPP